MDGLIFNNPKDVEFKFGDFQFIDFSHEFEMSEPTISNFREIRDKGIVCSVNFEEKHLHVILLSGRIIGLNELRVSAELLHS